MGKIFRRGLIALAPVAISIAIVIWLLKTLEDIFRVPVEWLVGKFYFPGMGLIVAVIFIFFVGIIINNFLMQKLTNWLDRLFTRIPLFKTIYNSIGDMMSYFSPKEKQAGGKVVIVEIDSLRFVGIVTREDLSGLPAELAEHDRVSVFIPFSYQIGGFTATIPRSKIIPLDMTAEAGMRFAVTAGMANAKGKNA